MIYTYSIHDLIPYINWVYYYYAWQLHDNVQQQKSREEAENLLGQLDGTYHVYGLFELFEAHAEDDDIIIHGTSSISIPCLRQQAPNSAHLCLADFVHPVRDQIGVFASSVDYGMECDFHHDPYKKMSVQLLADRLAEAAAERLHMEVRRSIWGYASDEQLSMDDLHAERFQGIRPAVGYPSLPDTSVNFILDRLIGFHQIGIRLTETGAMRPHASVSGLMISLSGSHYFSVGRVGEDQLRDYAYRRGLPVETLRRFLPDL